MTNTQKDIAAVPAERLTLGDLKHRAETIKDLAVSDAKDAVDRVLSADATKQVLIVAGVAVLVIGVAFMLGSRSGARRVPTYPE
ncbi:MAG: hypothetical protein U1E26_01670 [Coriobacteriia bacterium]|nr:hypothetical protein [Coriobacteriia bacterium]